MNKNIRYLLVIIIILSGVSGQASPKDIIKIVKDETILDEHIELFCLEYCQGNQRKGYLQSVFVDRLDPNRFRVKGKAALQNRHVITNPMEFVLFDHTVIIDATGTLTQDNCEIRLDDVYVQNDINNIFNTLLKENIGFIGRTEKIPDCTRFID